MLPKKRWRCTIVLPLMFLSRLHTLYSICAYNTDICVVSRASGRYPWYMGCSVLGRGAEPLVRTQFLEHPPTLNFGANHLKKWIQHPQKTPIPFLSPHNPHCRGGFWGGGSKS